MSFQKACYVSSLTVRVRVRFVCRVGAMHASHRNP